MCTHTPYTEHKAWHGVGATGDSMTWLSQSCHNAWAELQAHLHWLGTVAELHKQQFFMHNQHKRKNNEILYSSQLQPKKESVGFFKLFLWKNKCISLIQNAVIYFFKYPKGKSLEDVKWIQSLQPNQKTPCLSILLEKEAVPLKEKLLPRCRKPSGHK